MSRAGYQFGNKDRRWLAEHIRVGCLCRVEQFDPVKMTADVQPLSRVLEAGSYRTPPGVLRVPVALVRGGGFAVRPWYVPGDVGVLVYMDHDIDRILDSGQECQPNTERSHAGEDAVFVGAFVPDSKPLPELPAEALVLAAEGQQVYAAVRKDQLELTAGEAYVTLRRDQIALRIGAISILVGPDGITVTGNVTLNGNAVLTGDIGHTGSLTHTGDTTQTGQAIISGDVTAQGKSLASHTHTCPEGETGGPN